MRGSWDWVNLRRIELWWSGRIELWWSGWWVVVEVLLVRRSVRLLGKKMVIVRVVVVGEVGLEIVVGVVCGMVVAPVQGEVGVNVV